MAGHGKFRKTPKRCQCEVCGREWEEARYLTRITCSEECKRELIRRKRAVQDMGGRVRVHRLECAVCGAVFEMTGAERNWSQRETCSPGCEHALRSRRRGTRGLEPEQAAIVAAKRMRHPNTGPFETHWHAREWRLVSPDGTQHEVRNLALWLREHGAEHFCAEDLADTGAFCGRAYRGLARLAPWRADRRMEWRGWRWDW